MRCRLCGLICLIIISLCLPSCCFSKDELPDSRTKKYMQHELRRRNMKGVHMAGRMLIGPGSHPPRCIFKCGNCTPCRPIHVAVPPGPHVSLMEYYPEAWRCKCGNRLYMP